MKKPIEWKLKAIALGVAASLLLTPTPVRSAVQDNLESAVALVIGEKADTTDKENYTDSTVCAKLNLMQNELNVLQDDVTELKDTSPSTQTQVNITKKDGIYNQFYWDTMTMVGDDIYVIGTYHTTSRHLLRWHVNKWEVLGKLPDAIYNLNEHNTRLIYFDGFVYLFAIEQNKSVVNVFKYTDENGFSWVSSQEGMKNLGKIVLYKDKVHIFGGDSYINSHITWDGSNWEVLEDIPYKTDKKCCVAVFQDSLYYICYGTDNKVHVLKYNETSLEDESITTMTSYYAFFLTATDDALYLLVTASSDRGVNVYRVNIDLSVESLTSSSNGLSFAYSRSGHMFGGFSGTEKDMLNEYVWLDEQFVPSQLHKLYALEGEKIICDKTRTFVYGDNIEEIPEGWKVTANGNIGIEGECLYTIEH